MLDSLGERLSDENLARHGIRVPDAQSGLGPNLACSCFWLSWMHGDAVDVIGVVHEELLCVSALVHDDCNTCGNVGKLAILSVPEVVADIVAPEAMNVVELEL